MTKKKKLLFEYPYIGYEVLDNIPLLYGLKGNPIAIFKIENPVLESCSDIEQYQKAHSIFLQIIKLLGDNMILQKTDIISHKVFDEKGEKDVLDDKYLEHFNERKYKVITTYLSITESFIATSKIAKYNRAKLNDFLNKINKIQQILKEQSCNPVLLGDADMEDLMLRYSIFDFDYTKPAYADNIMAEDTHLQIGEKYVKCLTLVDTEKMAVPGTISTVDIIGGHEDSNTAYPVDNMRVLFEAEDYEILVYNQVIEVPQQTKTKAALELKQKRCLSVPDPINTLSAEDIDKILQDIARDGQLLVRAHFNIIIGCESMSKLRKCSNWFESSFFSKGFVMGRNSYNQMELWRSGFFGNGNELDKNDLFITASDSAIAFFFSERKQINEKSDFYFYFADRYGVPVRIDTEDLPMATGRISNRNKFVLGGSGTGKSFLMNNFIAQFLYYNTDVVIIDTGNSYKGTCDFFGGKYITYTEEKPISMNPFNISNEERNLEKYEFLSNLILLIYKDKGDNVTQDEYDIISDLINEYFNRHFDHQDTWYKDKSIEELKQYLIDIGVDEDTTGSFHTHVDPSHLLEKADISVYYKYLGVAPGTTNLKVINKAYRELSKKYHPDVSKDPDAESMMKNINFAINIIKDYINREKYNRDNRSELIKRIKKVDASLKVETLSFNSFYEFAGVFIPLLLRSTKLKSFDFVKFKYVLKKFYKGGRFDQILNEQADQSLLTEKFIVFEIDNVKDNPTLFPIVTLVIMDIFLQKMRVNDKQRKVLIIEEAWKAIASPLMSGYILYLYKTVRKFWGECIVVTQELQDIIDNPVVKESIINNSDSIILLDQAKYRENFSKVASILSLNAIEQSKIFTINQLPNKRNRGIFKEFYIKRGTTGEVYGNEVSMFQYLTFTTEKPEKNAIDTYKKHYDNYVDAIEHFISDMKKSGMNLSKFVKKINKSNSVFIN